MSSWIVITADPAKLRKVRRRLRRKGYAAYLPAIARVRAVAKGGKVKVAKIYRDASHAIRAKKSTKQRVVRRTP